MNERPIQFNEDMVQSILEDRKTERRRVVQGPINKPSLPPILPPCPYGAIGDHLWVQESFQTWQVDCREDDYDHTEPDLIAEYVAYQATPRVGRRHWVVGSSPHQPDPHHVRFLAESTPIDIDVKGAMAEGIRWPPRPGGQDGASMCADPRAAFAYLWDSIAFSGSAYSGSGWNSNPWVWVVKFRRVTP